MRIKIFSLVLCIIVTINTSTPCSASFFNDNIEAIHKKEVECNRNLLKGIGVFYIGIALLIIAETLFEYQDDKAISKIKENSEEYKNTKSVKEQAKISKAILTEYWTNFTFKKKWGRKLIQATLFLTSLCVAAIYFKRSFIIHRNRV